MGDVVDFSTGETISDETGTGFLKQAIWELERREVQPKGVIIIFDMGGGHMEWRSNVGELVTATGLLETTRNMMFHNNRFVPPGPPPPDQPTGS